MESSANPHSVSNIVKTFLTDMVYGGLAGIISKTIRAPFDRANELRHRGSPQPVNIRQVINANGFLDLWRGNGRELFNVFPAHALSFGLYTTFKSLLDFEDPRANPIQYTAACTAFGSLAGVITQTIVYPINFTAPIAVRLYHSKQSIKSRYKGLSLALVHIFLYRGVYFGAYDALKNAYHGNRRRFDLVRSYVYAYSATALASFIVYPFDTVRRRLLLQIGRNEKEYTGTIDCIRKIIGKEGYAAFYRGCFVSYSRAVTAALPLTLVDFFHSKFDNHRLF